MERGKRICMTLKELRKRIADANEIPYEIEECPHKGDCPGTCPKCESEVRYLMDAIDGREREGKPIKIEGLMSEDELRQVFSAAPITPEEPDIYETAGIPAPPEVFRLEGDPVPVGKMVEPLKGDIVSPYSGYEFAVMMFCELLANSSKDNLIYSPAGLCTILRMLQVGMDEKSKVYDVISELLARCFGNVGNEDTYNFRLEHATSLWYTQKLGSVKEEYIEELTDGFETEAHSTDFANKLKTKLWIDKWVSEKTHGMIPKLDAESSEDALLVLLDAIYMKGKWESPFDPDCTEKDIFHNADGTESEVDMMYQDIEEAEYGETDEYQVINLPYMDSDYSMVVVKPKEGHSLEEVVRGHGWLDVEPIEADCEVELMMPRFEFNNTLSFVDILKKLGLKDLFDTETSLPKITDEPAHISQIKQQCVIKVEEEGTEAAAITMAECAAGCPPPDDMPMCYEMRLDVPFAFAIKDSYGTILFMGVIKSL